MTTNLSRALAAAIDGDMITVSGALTDVIRHTSVQGRAWASAWLTGGTKVEALIFPRTYARVHQAVTEGANVEVTARYDTRDGDERLLVQNLRVLVDDDR